MYMDNMYPFKRPEDAGTKDITQTYAMEKKEEETPADTTP